MSKLIVEPSPHIKSGNTTQKIMLYVIIALAPTLVAAIYYYGIRALILTAVCVFACIVFEYIFNIITKRDNTVSDLSAAVTGMILAFNLPANLPIYMAIIGCFVAIVVTKMMFGGIGQNFANPAITGRIVLTLSFSTHMSSYPVPITRIKEGIVATATPLVANLEAGDYIPSNMDLFLGNHGGSMGETCAITLLIGFVILLSCQVINPVTPLSFVGTVAIISFISGGSVAANGDFIREILLGGVLLGAVFMVTDYSTTPITPKGKLIFGIGCGLITMIIRLYAAMPEGVSFSILIMNVLTPFIDKYTRPRPFGMKKEVKKNA